ncbi:hypothetical protein RJ55_05788 [Drechmeria coniospora]|nr:hypothetical protein RJ55_05788 [Drechmeria coniospora]
MAPDDQRRGKNPAGMGSNGRFDTFGQPFMDELKGGRTRRESLMVCHAQSLARPPGSFRALFDLTPYPAATVAAGCMPGHSEKPTKLPQTRTNLLLSSLCHHHHIIHLFSCPLEDGPVDAKAMETIPLDTLLYVERAAFDKVRTQPIMGRALMKRHENTFNTPLRTSV